MEINLGESVHSFFMSNEKWLSSNGDLASLHDGFLCRAIVRRQHMSRPVTAATAAIQVGWGTLWGGAGLSTTTEKALAAFHVALASLPARRPPNTALRTEN